MVGIIDSVWQEYLVVYGRNNGYFMGGIFGKLWEEQLIVYEGEYLIVYEDE